MRLILALLLCLPAVAARATLLEEVVVTASRTAQPIANVSTNVALLPGKDLTLIGAVHISQAMYRIPGAWISRGNGQESLTALRSPVLTGSGACGAFLMAEDDIPLRASGFCNVNELFDANTEQATAIEVIKGPAGVMYGSNAMHGMINVLTAPVGEVHTLSIEGGPHDYLRGKMSMGGTNWRIDANGTTDGGYRADSGYDQQKFTAKVKSQVGAWQATTTLAEANLNQETAGYIQGHDAYKDDTLRTTNPNPEAYRDTKAFRLHSRLEKDAGQAHYVVTPYARYTAMNFLQHYLPGQPIEDNGQKSLGVQTSGYWPNWTAGIDAEITNAYLKEYQPGPTTGSAFLVATIPQGMHYNYDVTATTFAAFAQRKFELGAITSLRLGARAEYVGYQYNNRMLAGRTKDDGTPCGFGGCRFNRPADRNDHFINVSPHLGVIWDVRRNVQLYLNITSGFRAPQAAELYKLQNDQNISNIDSVRLDSVELGYRGGDTVFNWAVSTYVMRKRNYIFQNTNRENVDNGKTSHRGIEVALSRQLTDRLKARFNWSYAIHRYENTPSLVAANITGNDIDTAPRNMGWAALEWRAGEKMRAELEWIHMGRYYEDPENLHSYGGHDLVNLRARAQLSETLAATVRITNLTDTRYAERADYSFGKDRYFVGKPRAAYFSVEMSL